MDFAKNFNQNIKAIELCVNKGLICPALTLIYSSIDVISWLAFGDIEVKKRYTNWIDQWMYKNRKLEATPIDLYAARCAILHTLTPDSNLSEKGEAKIISYAWGNDAKLSDYKEVANKRGIYNQVYIHLSELFEIFKKGIEAFFDELNTNEELQKGFNGRLNKSFDNMSVEEVQSYQE